MKRLLKRFLAHRPSIIAVIGLTREDLEAGLAHAQTAHADLPIQGWCAADVPPVPGYTRFVSNATASLVRAELRGTWPALVVVSWTGQRRCTALKLLPFTTPPFRFVIFNEARGFSAATPVYLARHAYWRIRIAIRDNVTRATDRIAGCGLWLRSLIYRGSERALDLVHWFWSLALAALAILAQATPWLSRSLMQRFLRQTPATRNRPIPPTVARGSEYIEVNAGNRAWARRNLIGAARHYDVDFIVFRRNGEQADAGPLIDLARSTNAFAVARQSAYSGWGRRVVARHPFRRLQPGEVTEVLAPFSTLIVMRRDLLLELGVPHAFTWGAALAILFRKAAHAGYRSIVAGHHDNIGEEPAMALEDLEFVARAALSPSLRPMSPAHPLRSRGNIATRGPRCGIFHSKPRVLIVSPYLPFPLSHGGAVRIYNLCKAMAGEIDFILACFREVNDFVAYPELHEVFRQVYAVDADEKHSDPSVPAQVTEYRNSAMADLIRRLCLGGEVDVVQLEYTQMAEYRDCTGAVPVILVEHDITFTLHRQIADAIPHDSQARRQYELWHTFERQALQCTQIIWTMSRRDREVAVANGASRRNTIVVPNGVDLNRFHPSAREGGDLTILFVGSFRHLPNLLAFEALRETVMPDVWRRCPDAKLHVVAGPQHERAVAVAGKYKLLAPDPRVNIDGFVEDVRPAYRACDLVVIPLPISAGTNIKLAEAMACGRAVVSTPAGCQGFDVEDGRELLIRSLGLEFAEAIVCLLIDEKLRGRLASSGRQMAVKSLGWDAIAREALGCYSALIEAGISRSFAAR